MDANTIAVSYYRAADNLQAAAVLAHDAGNARVLRGESRYRPDTPDEVTGLGYKMRIAALRDAGAVWDSVAAAPGGAAAARGHASPRVDSATAPAACWPRDAACWPREGVIIQPIPIQPIPLPPDAPRQEIILQSAINVCPPGKGFIAAAVFGGLARFWSPMHGYTTDAPFYLRETALMEIATDAAVKLGAWYAVKIFVRSADEKTDAL